MNLAQLEALFWQAARAHTPPRGLAEHFVGSRALNATRRMGIYHAAYWARQERTLAEIFARTSALLGPDAFRAKVADYLERYPSEAPAIEWVGRRFAGFLAEDPTLPAELTELARLEWARLESRMAPDAQKPLTKKNLRGVDFASVRVTLRPSVRRLRLSPSALALLDEGSELSSSAPEPAVGCLVFRTRGYVKQRTLTQAEERALERAAGATFAEICEVFEGPAAVATATEHIERWLRDEVLAFEH